MRRICVFCASSFGTRSVYLEVAREVGTPLANRSLGLVYGGAKVGLMGAIADSALAAGGEVIGVIPDGLVLKEVAHASLTELRIVHSMHERKSAMAELADGFIALPGGFGTFEEFFEILTWGQLGLHTKPCGLLNVAGYYDHLLRMVDHAVEERLLKQENRDLILTSSNATDLLTQMEAFQPAATTKWLEPTET